MIRDFRDVGTDHIGFYCGVATSAFSVGQSIVSLLWGYLSDRVGRRPVLLAGLILSSVSIIGFGLSNSTSMTIWTRLLAGSSNGTSSVAKAAFNEISTDKTRPLIFSLLGICWSIGMILGPVFGGVFSNPAVHFPTLFNFAIFEKFPYLLPCLVQASIGGFGFVLGIFLLPETSMQLGVYHILTTIDLVEDEEDHEEEDPSNLSLLIPDHVAGHDSVHSRFYSPDPASTIFLNTSTTRIEIQDMLFRIGGASQHSFPATEELFDAQSEGFLAQDQLSDNDGDSDNSKISIMDSSKLLSSSQIIIAYGLLHFQNIFFEEVYSLWAVAPTGVGLGFSSESLGILIFFVGAITFGFAVFYPYFAKSMDKIVLMLQSSYPLYLLVWMMLPLITALLSSSPHSMFIEILLFFALSLRRLANVLAFTSANILLQSSASPMNLGFVNGLAATFASLLRSIGPITAGLLWSWSLIEGKAPPFNQYLVFFVLSLLSLLGFLQSLFLKTRVRDFV